MESDTIEWPTPSGYSTCFAGKSLALAILVTTIDYVDYDTQILSRYSVIKSNQTCFASVNPPIYFHDFPRKKTPSVRSGSSQLAMFHRWDDPLEFCQNGVLTHCLVVRFVPVLEANGGEWWLIMVYNGL